MACNQPGDLPGDLRRARIKIAAGDWRLVIGLDEGLNIVEHKQDSLVLQSLPS